MPSLLSKALSKLPGKAGKAGAAVGKILDKTAGCVWKKVKLLPLGKAISADVAGGSGVMTAAYLTPIVLKCAGTEETQRALGELLKVFGVSSTSPKGKEILGLINKELGITPEPVVTIQWENHQASQDLAKTAAGQTPLNADQLEAVAAKLRAGTPIGVFAGATVIGHNQLAELKRLVAKDGPKDSRGFNTDAFLSDSIKADLERWAAKHEAELRATRPRRAKAAAKATGITFGLSGVLFLLNLALG